jgi:adenosine deaminase/adenosine deaminase CECR1
MKKPLIHAIALALAASALNAAAREPRAQAGQADYQATRRYYQQLVSGPTPQLSELKLLMAMLPKGGDLHHHYSGAIYAETYLDWVAQKGYCIYTASDPANKTFKYRIETTLPAPGAPPHNNCLSVAAIRDAKDTTFYRELLAQWSTMDFHNHGQVQLAPDQHFFNTFNYFGDISGYSYKLGFQQLKRRAKDENVQYIESMVKSAPALSRPDLAKAIDELPAAADDAALAAALAPYADFVQNHPDARQAIAGYVQALEDDLAGIDDSEFTLRAQTYVSRNKKPSEVFAGLAAAFAASDKSPLIVGVNIVGPENGVVALRDYQLHMRMFAFLKQRYPKVRLAMHAGELVPGLVPPEDLRSHVASAVRVAGAQRIGHGVDIVHEARADQLLADLKARQVAVEINLTSNDFILGVKGEAHPVTTYLRHGVPIVLSTDDAGVSRHDLSGEYVLFASRYRPSYDTLKQVVYNSIRYAFLAPEEKAAQTRQLDLRFARFEQAVAAMARRTK